jgi:hypothetical protein
MGSEIIQNQAVPRLEAPHLKFVVNTTTTDAMGKRSARAPSLKRAPLPPGSLSRKALS